MKNLIVSAFAFKEGLMTSIQLNKPADSTTTEMYLKNLMVSLASAKMLNPDDDVCLCTNIDLPGDWNARFQKAGITVLKREFDSFVLPDKFQWSLAFYKMCVLNGLVKEGGYDRYLLLDADTYTTHDYKDLWAEADKGIVLYPLGHTYSHPDRDVIRRDFERLCPEEAKVLPITHYGGEFVCGTKEALVRFMDVCLDLFAKASGNNFDVEATIGDESLWSIAAALLYKEIPVIPATPYIFRFWTEDFYLVSTVTVSNPVSIWHLPAEKDKGFIRMYNAYVKTGRFPDVDTAARNFGIVKAKRPFNAITLSNKINRKVDSWKKKK